MQIETLYLSFDCVLPSAIFFNQHIEPSAIRCYAIVRNLTKLEGFCFASNEYLSKILQVDISTIKRWIRSLSKQGYLKIITEKIGINRRRLIYLADGFKKSFRRLKNEPPKAQFRTPPSSKMSHIKEEETKEEEKKEKENAKAYSSDKGETPKSELRSQISFSFEKMRFENIELKDIESWKELYPSVDIDKELKLMTEWIRCNERKARSKKHWRKFINLWLAKNNEREINREAAKSRGFSNEIDRRPRDKDGNIKQSQYAGMF